MPRTKASLEKRKQALVARLEDHLDFLIGSVVTYHLKCSKHCRCHQGKGHAKVYLSTKQGGKTRNQYVPRSLVKRARQMTRTYGRLRQVLKDISRVNYALLRETRPAERRQRP